MPDTAHQKSRSPSADASHELEALESGSQRSSLRQTLSKPVSIVAIVLAVVVVVVVGLLQQDPGAFRLQTPEARYSLLPPTGQTPGVPVAIQLGPLALFKISDSGAGGAGAARARRIAEGLSAAVLELEETPGRVITIETGTGTDMPRVVQKVTSTAAESLEIVQVEADDLVLAGTEDAKLLARVWAERLTDSLRLLLFGEPPEFSRQTAFGMALDTMYVNAREQDGRLTTEALMLAFEELPEAAHRALTEFEALLPEGVEESGAADQEAQAALASEE